MSYFGELRTNWEQLAAATAGLSAGLSLSAYTNALMAPQFLAEFGWSRSDFALTGVITLLTFVFLPVAGRLTDLFGVRRVAIVGVLGLPAGWIAYAMMSGAIWQYFAVTAALITVGVTTTPAIYSRIVATRFDTARGLALAIAISGPPLSAPSAPRHWMRSTTPTAGGSAAWPLRPPSPPSVPQPSRLSRRKTRTPKGSRRRQGRQ